MSSVKPWQNSKQLRNRLKPRLEEIGIKNANKFLEEIAKEINRSEREELFVSEEGAEKTQKKEFKEEKIPETYELEANSIITDGDVLP